MIVGHPLRRADDISDTSPEYRQTSYRCFEDDDPLANAVPGYPGDTFHLPNKFCTHGIRSNIYFPQCVSIDDVRQLAIVSLISRLSIDAGMV
jgi:hypothetical protein